jgi:transcriptional regulator with XRE-family HTH domain
VLEVLMPICDRLKELRAKKRMTQEALARAAGLSLSAVVQLEAGRVPDPRVGTLRKIAKALGVSLDALAGDNGGEGERPRKRK